jgi:dipeptidyl aminopeptidase/acylaminoacyl peptidase
MAAVPYRFDYARFLNVRRAYGPSFSPDGRRVAFVADLTGVPQLFRVPAAWLPGGGWPEQLTFTQERIGLVAFAPPAAGPPERMVVAGDVGGDERVRLWRLSENGEEMRPLTDDPAAMHRFGRWSPDGTRIAYAANGRDPRCFDPFVQSVETGQPRRLFESDGNCSVECWRPDGAALVVSRHRGSFDNDLFEVEVATGQARLLTPHDGMARFERASYASDGRTIWLLADRDSEFMAVARLDPARLELRTVLDLGWDVEDLALSPADGGGGGQRMALHANVDGFSELYVRDLARGHLRKVALPPGVVSRGFVGNWRDSLAWSPDGGRLAFSFTTARETQNVWLTEPLGPPGAAAEVLARRLTHATGAGIPTEVLAEPSLLRYPSFDGRGIPAFLYTPLGASADGQHAAVVLIHGGPESQVRPGFDPTVQYFVHRGYVVLTPNVRGSTGYGKSYGHLDDRERRMDAVADARAAADWLVARGWAHPRRVAAMGQSYGGFMVLASLCTYPETWAAGVDLYGIASFVSFLENTHPSRREHREAEYGRLDGDRAMLERISPLTRVDRIRAPLLAVHGQQDPRVPIGETEQVVAALRARGVPTELIRLPDEGHGVVKLANRLRVWPAVADFLDRHLGR